jgi:hypothetical protein
MVPVVLGSSLCMSYEQTGQFREIVDEVRILLGAPEFQGVCPLRLTLFLFGVHIGVYWLLVGLQKGISPLSRY